MDTRSLRYMFAVICFLHLTSPTLSLDIALLIIDVQNCFLPGGSLAVTDGESVIPVINNIRSKYGDSFKVTILSQDWHCSDHVSFASQHAGKNVYDETTLKYDVNGTLCMSTCTVAYNVSQTLWPDHCVMNTQSANLSSSLTTSSSDIIVKKGYNCDVDSYSAFYDNGGFSHTELNSLLKSHRIDTVVVTGLALDYCVYYTSKDAQELGYIVYTVLDASRPVSNVTMATALDDLRQKGVNLIQSSDLEDIVTSAACHVQPVLLVLLIIQVVRTLFY